jgi:hypothetical protein
MQMSMLHTFNVDENLSIRPVLYPNDVTLKTNVGLTFNYNFRAKAIRCFVSKIETIIYNQMKIF